MNAAKAPPGPIDYGYLLALAAMWGGSFILIKIALADIPPATVTSGRLVLGAGLLFVVARGSLGGLSWDWRTIGLILLVGLVGNAAPFGLIAWGEEVVDAGLASILMGIMPIATLVMAHFVPPGEPLNVRKVVGVSIGFIGLVVLVGPALLLDLGQDGIRQLAILAAAICYGISAILTRRLLDEPRLQLGAAVLLAGALGIVPIALALEQPWTLSPGIGPMGAVLILGALPTGFAAILVFQLIDRQGAGFFGQVNLLVPIMGVFWAMTILGEMPEPRAWLALVLILLGIAVARGGQRAAVEPRRDASRATTSTTNPRERAEQGR